MKKATKKLPFISLLLIASLAITPFILAFEGGSFGGSAGGFNDGSFGGASGGFNDGSFGGAAGGFQGGSYGGTAGGFQDGSYGGTAGGFNGGSFGGSFGGTGSTDTGSFDGPGSFDDGFGGFPDGGNGFPPGGLPPGGPGGFPTEADAVWQDLLDVTIAQGSPSGTLIQQDVFSKCTDADDELLTFNITSQSDNFDLFFTDDDVRMFNLDPAFIGTETVTLTCNNIPESFMLHVIAHGTTVPETTTENDDKLSVHIGSIIIPNAYDAEAGDLVPITISFRNNGDSKLENLKAAVKIQDLGVRASVGPLDLSIGKRISKTIMVELPEDVQPGTYYVRITIDSGSLHRIVHRDVDVIE